MRHSLVTFVVLALMAGASSCSKPDEEVKKEKVIVVAIPQHPHTFNPVMAKNQTAKEISTLVYPGLYFQEFNMKKNAAEFVPQVASWSEAFGSYVMVRIKPDAKWSDDIPVSAKDIIYSYQLYANEQLGTVWRPMLKGLKTDAAGNIDIAEAIQMDDDSTVTFNFVNDSSVNYAVFTVPILPKHQMDALPLTQLKASIPVKAPTLAGPFLVAGLNDKEIVLKSNELSIIPGPARVDKIVFRVLPNKKATVDAFTAGQIDVVSGLTSAEIAQISEVREDVDVVVFPPMRYHVIGWNNIDPEIYRSSNGEKLKANRMFGPQKLRRAMTLALNRDEILTKVVGNDVLRAFGPVSPMFKAEYHDTLHQLYCDPLESKQILARDTWQDLVKSGTVEKFNKPFAFDLKVSAADERGKQIAEMVKTQLKEISVDVTVVPVDSKLFPQMLKEKDFDAFIGSVDIPQDLSLQRYWGMDLQQNDMNFVSFRNRRVDEILDSASFANASERIRLWKEFQDILQEQQPYTFLYWESNYAVKSKRVSGMNLTPNGFMSRPWEWSVKE
ncbi:MAG: ABC transporter substrate-binding protein [Bacteroidota bacterium]